MIIHIETTWEFFDKQIIIIVNRAKQVTGFEIDIQTSISYPEETTISKGMNNYIQKLFSAKKKQF